MSTVAKVFYDHAGNKCIRRSDGSLSVQTVNDLPSLTEQSHRDSCDINKIMANYEKTGVAPISGKIPTYGDFSEVKDYAEALTLLMDANEAFMELPAKVRLEYQNDPALFLEAMEDPVKRQELVDKGLLPGSELGLTVTPLGDSRADEGGQKA